MKPIKNGLTIQNYNTYKVTIYLRDIGKSNTEELNSKEFEVIEL